MTSEIVIDAREFAEAVGWAAKWIDHRAAAPVQRGLMLEVDPDAYLTISAFSETATARATVSLLDDAAGIGRAVVSGRLLAELAGTLGKDKTVTLDREGDTVRMTAGKFIATLPAMPEQDFPTLPAQAPTIGRVTGAALAEGVSRAGVAAKRDGDGAWAALYLGFGEHGIETAATDRNRVATDLIAWHSTERETIASATPVASAVMDAAASFAGAEVVEIGCNGPLLSLTTPTRSLTMTTVSIDGPGYPIGQLRSYLSMDTTHTFSLDVADAVTPLKRARIMRGKEGPIRITLRGDEMLVGATEAEGSAAAAAPVDIAGYEGEEFVIGMDPVLFGDALSTAPGGTVTINFNPDPRKAFVLTCADHPNWRHLLMPRRIDL